ncbi:MAG: nucleotidyltransferase domain-containing protein [Candidatus Micrarchaeota archaeon]|nr:nucleotidyltransferase domain-containing protein [Candidatus Micrarchaeota archaeon]
MDRELVERIKKDFADFEDTVFAIILFGSFARGEQTEKSDIDICLVAREKVNETWNRVLESGLTEKYDIKIFELLPLKLKIEVINTGKVIFCKDENELSYYFWKFRKIWQDEILQKKKLGLKIYE